MRTCSASRPRPPAMPPMPPRPACRWCSPGSRPAADDPSAGYAIVGENAAAAKLHAVGSTLPGGARLHSVYGDRIVIERGGVLESLTLPKQLLASMNVPPPPPPSADAGSPIDRVRQAIQQNPGAISDVIRSQQVIAGGKQRGFRVYPGRNPAAFSRLGLRPGDLITAVNGTPLDDPLARRGSDAHPRQFVRGAGHRHAQRKTERHDLEHGPDCVRSRAVEQRRRRRRAGRPGRTPPPSGGTAQ